MKVFVALLCEKTDCMPYENSFNHNLTDDQRSRNANKCYEFITGKDAPPNDCGLYYKTTL
ncbi:hypothetical protein AHF37_02291 [Paragonimus kellicotti]|nr:hypothetical protein AHF37_02291 [Paragonimus kellicotti]